MVAVIDTFSRTYDYHRMPIRKGFGPEGEKLEDFLDHFRNDYYPETRIKFVDPGLVWQGCQYDGFVCVGIYWVHTLTEKHGTVHQAVGIIHGNVHHLEHAALRWLREHRQKNPDNSGRWPEIQAQAPYDHCVVSPVLIPDEGML